MTPAKVKRGRDRVANMTPEAKLERDRERGRKRYENVTPAQYEVLLVRSRCYYYANHEVELERARERYANMTPGAKANRAANRRERERLVMKETPC